MQTVTKAVCHSPAASVACVLPSSKAEQAADRPAHGSVCWTICSLFLLSELKLYSGCT